MRINSFTFGLLLTCTFASVTLGTHVDDVTQILNGLASNVQGTINTASIASCGTESIFGDFMTGILPIMDEVASCNPLDFSDIQSKIAALMKAVPDTAKQCAKTNADAQKMLAGLGIAGLTPDQIKSKVTSYVMDNLLSICGTFGDLNDKLKGGDFVGFGTEAGKIALDIFKSSRSHREVARDIVFALMNADQSSIEKIGSIISGLASASSASIEVAELTKCLEAPFADAVISVITDVTAKVATFDMSVFKDKTFAEAQLAKLSKTFTPKQLECTTGSAETGKLINAFGLNAFSVEEIMNKSVNYAINNVFKLLGMAAKLNGDITKGDWNHYGLTVGQTVVEIVKTF